MTELISYAKGNPGAITFLIQVFVNPNSNLTLAIKLENKLKTITTLRGTNIYVLYSDLANKNMEKLELILDKVPNDTLEEACSKQDYSGRELIKPFI